MLENIIIFGKIKKIYIAFIVKITHYTTKIKVPSRKGSFIFKIMSVKLQYFQNYIFF